MENGVGVREREESQESTRQEMGRKTKRGGTGAWGAA